MYTDKKDRSGLWTALAAVLLFAVLLVLLLTQGARGDDIRNEGAAAIRAVIEDTARQCYVVEGVYPPNLAYLEEHYGIQINTKDYYVTYEAFASNLPPSVRVAFKPKS